MSVREEQEQRKSSSGRSAGLAAAAIGVVGIGVGAALYYLFKRSEAENSEEASHSHQQQWNIEHTFKNSCDNDKSYTTISEHTTTDTSVYDNSDIDCTNNCTNNTPNFVEGNMDTSDDFQSDTSLDLDNDGDTMSTWGETINEESDFHENSSDNESSAEERFYSNHESLNEGTNNSNNEEISDSNDESFNDEINYSNNDSIIDASNSIIDGADSIDNDSEFLVNNSDLNNDNNSMNNDDDSMNNDSVNILSDSSNNEESDSSIMLEWSATEEEANETSEINETGYITRNSRSASNGDTTFSTDNDWDVTEMDDELPSFSMSRSPMQVMASLVNRMTSYVGTMQQPKMREQEKKNLLRQQAFRERSWSLEECSICFDVMLKDQDLVSLPCAHNFHVACIGPWLEQQSTCPNCRKTAE